jgi:uncharacterized protein YbbK (DUF523 family)
MNKQSIKKGRLMKRRRVMVSACLLGWECRYDGQAKTSPELADRLAEFELISVCPECLGNLPIPRLPAEIQNGDGAAVWAGEALVLNRRGDDYTPQFRAGAAQVLDLYRSYQPEFLVFKSHSPSCGVSWIYDGSFTGVLRPGDGVTAALLRADGAVLYTEADFLSDSVAARKQNQ